MYIINMDKQNPVWYSSMDFLFLSVYLVHTFAVWCLCLSVLCNYPSLYPPPLLLLLLLTKLANVCLWTSELPDVYFFFLVSIGTRLLYFYIILFLFFFFLDEAKLYLFPHWIISRLCCFSIIYFSVRRRWHSI